MDITPEQLQHEFGLNVYGTIYLTQAVVGLGKMPQGGRIINVSSIASKLGLDGVTVYSAAKAAQDSITASLACEVSNLFTPSSADVGKSVLIGFIAWEKPWNHR